MSNATKEFEFTVVLHPEGNLKGVFAREFEALTDTDARKLAKEEFPGHKVLAAKCETPRWRREIGHAIISEKEIEVHGQKCLEVETEFAVVLVGPEDVYASISKVRREAYYWGIWAAKKYGRLRGHAAGWFETQQHRVGRKGIVKSGSKKTFQTCGGEIYYQATTGDTYREKGEREYAARRAKIEAARVEFQPRIDSGEFDPKNFENYREAEKAFDAARREVGLNWSEPPRFDTIYARPPRKEVAA